MINAKNAFIVSLIAIVIALGGYFFPQFPQKVVSTLGEIGTRFPNGLAVGPTSIVVPQPGTITTAKSVYVGGLLATATPASLTLQASDLIGYSTISFTPGVAAVTVTLPATSTLTTWLPNAGDRTTLTFINASSTAGTNLTIAGGTGTLLKVASSTTAKFGTFITPLATARIDVVRKEDSDLVFAMTMQN